MPVPGHVDLTKNAVTSVAIGSVVVVTAVHAVLTIQKDFVKFFAFSCITL